MLKLVDDASKAHALKLINKLTSARVGVRVRKAVDVAMFTF